MSAPRNLWPFGIIAAFVLFLAGTAGLVVLARAHRGDLVSGNYYEAEVRYQSQLDRADRARSLAPKTIAAYEPATRCIVLSFPPEHAQRSARGWIQLYRPSAAGLDRVVELRLDANGRQTIDAAGLKPGLWEVRINWTAGDEDFFLERKIIIGAED